MAGSKNQQDLPFLQPYVFRGGVSAKNRVVLAPMTNGQSHVDGSLGEDEFTWLQRRAEGGFGTLITCAAHICEDAKGWEGELGVFSASHAEGLKKIASVANANNALSVVQLFHGGARSPSILTGKQPLSASAFELQVPGFEKPREATADELRDIEKRFVESARLAVASGFSGVELHGANGYLITQLLSTATNFRSDEYGGTVENRARFLLNIVSKTREALGKKSIIGVRLSPENFGAQAGLDVDEMLDVAFMLAEAHVDYIHLSLANASKIPQKYTDGKLTITEMFRKRIPTGVALMVSGNIWTAANASHAMDLGADFVSLGKAGIAHSSWPKECVHPKFTPVHSPWDEAYLKKQGVGENFVKILERMRLLK